MGCMHRDMKEDNIFCAVRATERDWGVYKVGDFGLCAPACGHKTACGTEGPPTSVQSISARCVSRAPIDRLSLFLEFALAVVCRRAQTTWRLSARKASPTTKKRTCTPWARCATTSWRANRLCYQPTRCQISHPSYPRLCHDVRRE